MRSACASSVALTSATPRIRREHSLAQCPHCRCWQSLAPWPALPSQVPAMDMGYGAARPRAPKEATPVAAEGTGEHPHARGWQRLALMSTSTSTRQGLARPGPHVNLSTSTLIKMMTVAMAMVMSVATTYRGKLLRGEEALPTYLNAGKSGRHSHGWHFHGGAGRARPHNYDASLSVR